MRNKDSEIIDKMGGTSAVAKLCNVSSQAVSRWRKNGIPKSRILYFKLLKPSVFFSDEKHADTELADKKPETVESTATRVISADHDNKLIIDPVNRKSDRRTSERRSSERRQNSNGGGRRVGERRMDDRRVAERRTKPREF